MHRQILKTVCAAALGFPAGVSGNDLPPGGFIEPETPFLRTALVVEEGEDVNRSRRGVVVPLGGGAWGCFDPDLLRWAVFWEAGEGTPPISMDSMAAISYPDAKAKASRPPHPRGTTLRATAEKPGGSPGKRPQNDPRASTLVGSDDPVGPLPVAFGRWEGISLSGDTPVLHYRLGDRRFSEIVSGGPDRIERLLRIEPGEDAVSLRLHPTMAEPDGARAAIFDDAEFSYLTLAGEGARLSAGTSDGTWVIIEPASEPRVIRLRRSREKLAEAQVEPVFPEIRPAEPLFPETIEVASAGTREEGAFTLRPMNLPTGNPQGRAVRPMDLGFLSNGEALLCTFDGDVWRIRDIDGEAARWTRVATGIFEPTNIEIGPDDGVFVLGRDQITELVDTNGDGHFDLYRNRSDQFEQTLHTRDYAMSMSLAPDGSFYVAKGGIVEMGSAHNREMSRHRGAIVRISPDGTEGRVAAEGLRLPYVGVRGDGAVFASDQQGHHVPSTPVYLLEERPSYYGYRPSRHREELEPAEPLLWFPYQANRSGAGFAALAGDGFPDAGGAFTQISWNGSLFPLVTPEEGMPFAWKLPFDLPFPSLNGASHPRTGELFVAGLGISGYSPTTPEFSGFAGVRQRDPIAVPGTLEVEEDRIRVGFREALDAGRLPTVASLRFWNIRRTGDYGSGHYGWDGDAGEHAVVPERVNLSDDRRHLEIEIPPVFRSDVMELSLRVMETGSAASRPLTLFARPVHLDEPDARELADVAGRERDEKELEPGNPTRGKKVFTMRACVGCHSVEGQTQLAGPPLNGIASRHADELDAYLRESILEPNKTITDGYEAAMPSFDGVIPAQELEDLIAYLKTLD